MVAPRGTTILLGAVVLLTVQTAGAARPAKPPKDAPYCLPSGTTPVFVAPMGQVFRGEAGKPYPAGAWIAEADADRDWRVSRTEMIADANRFFVRLDGNKDGSLTPDEVARYETEMAPESALYAGRREAGGQRRHGLFSAGGTADYAGPVGAGHFAWLNIPEPVAAADADLDRVVTLAEFSAAAGHRFDLLARGAAFLTPATLPRTPQQAALEGPCRPAARPLEDESGAAGDAASARGGDA